MLKKITKSLIKPKSLEVIVAKLAEKSKRTWTYRGKKETSDSVDHIWNRLRTRNGGYVYEINKNYPYLESIVEKHPDVKEGLYTLLRQIETGLPLNALYLDLSNDEKIENDEQISFEEVKEMTIKILETTDMQLHKTMIETLVQSEPFSFYKNELLEEFSEE